MRLNNAKITEKLLAHEQSIYETRLYNFGSGSSSLLLRDTASLTAPWILLPESHILTFSRIHCQADD